MTVCRRVLLENGITRRLHLFNQLQNEIKTIEQTFDARSRLLRNGITIRLAHSSQLLAEISPQSLVPLYAQRRQNAVDLVDDRSPLPDQILPFSRRTPRFPSASLGIGTIEQTRGSPCSQAIKVQKRNAAILPQLDERQRRLFAASEAGLRGMAA